MISMNRNNLTLIIDGNWFLMSRMFVMVKKFSKDQSEQAKQASTQDLCDMLGQSISIILNKFRLIDNIVVVSDGGSWRKEIPIPAQLKDTTYKGSRTQQSELDWDLVWSSFNEFLNRLRSAGVTVSQGYEIEGDDWAWYWTRRLNNNEISTLIWTSDCDLKQLVQTKGSSFTGWYNDKAGLVLPGECKTPDDPLEYFLNPPFINNYIIQLTKQIQQTSYINPQEIAINKILCGDQGDNIKSIVRFKKNERTYKFSQKDYEKLLDKIKINNVNDILNQKETIAENIINSKKFAPYKFSTEQICEMLDYNTKLVWLNEKVIPQPIITQMCQQKYKIINTDNFRNNYSSFIKDNTKEADLEEIFNGCF